MHSWGLPPPLSQLSACPMPSGSASAATTMHMPVGRPFSSRRSEYMPTTRTLKPLMCPELTLYPAFLDLTTTGPSSLQLTHLQPVSPTLDFLSLYPWLKPAVPTLGDIPREYMIFSLWNNLFIIMKCSLFALKIPYLK